MTKQDFLEGKEFKTDSNSTFIYKYKYEALMRKSTFIYKYKYEALMRKFPESDYRFEASIIEVNDDGIKVMSGILGDIFYVNKKFSDLILV